MQRGERGGRRQEEDYQRQNTGRHAVCFDGKAISKEERKPGIAPVCFPFLSLPPQISTPESKLSPGDESLLTPQNMDTSISEPGSSETHIVHQNDLETVSPLASIERFQFAALE